MTASQPAPGEEVPAVIVGAGPVGLTAGLLLARRGIACLILERHPAPYPLPRAVHLDGEVARILQAAGVADGFREISRAMPGLRLVDARLRTIAEFRRASLIGSCGHPEASMFDQPDLERLLLGAVEREPRITLRRGAVVTAVGHRPGGAVVRYEHDGGLRHVRAAAVLGCDGAGSTVRAALDIAFRDLGFTERWLVIDVRSPRPLDVWDGVHQICDSRRAGTFMHIRGDRYRWEFRILDSDDVTELLSPAGIGRLLAPWTAGPGSGRLELVRGATYTFRARIAERWRERRVFLLGDAAHQTPPFIGQGLGSGLRDAHNLAWKLDLVLRGDAPEALLDTYQAERAPHTVRLIRGAITVGWALTGGGGRTAVLRRVLVRGLSRTRVARAALNTSSPRLRLGRGPRRRGASPIGLPCPQPREGDGWFDHTLGDGFALVTLDPVTAGPAAPRVVRVAASSPLGRWLARSKARAALVRPDRIVCDTARSRGEIPRLLTAPGRTAREIESALSAAPRRAAPQGAASVAPASSRSVVR